jgi:hypothetical protein
MTTKNPLTPKEMNIINSLGKVRMVRLFTKLYNSICKDCKKKVLKNPKTPLTDFCFDCQMLIKEKLQKYIK